MRRNPDISDVFVIGTNTYNHFWGGVWHMKEHTQTENDQVQLCTLTTKTSEIFRVK
jgi:hypothetical protein